MERRTITQKGFERIAEAAIRQQDRSAARAASLEPSALHYASAEDVQQDFDRRPDGLLVDRIAHRVWEMKARPDGSFDVLRAQQEPAVEPGETKPSEEESSAGKLARAASRGAQYLPGDMGAAVRERFAQMPAPMPSEPMPQEAVGHGAGKCQDCGATDLPMTGGCPQCGSPNVVENVEAQAPVAPPTPAMGVMGKRAGLRDVVEQPADRRLAGLRRGTKVLVRMGARKVERGKLLARVNGQFDVLLENGATARVAQRDLAVDQPAVKTTDVPTPAPVAAAATPDVRQAVDEKAKEYWTKYFQEYGRQLVKEDLPTAVTDHAQPASSGRTTVAAKAGDYVDVGNAWMHEGSKLRTGIVRVGEVLEGEGGHRLLAVRDPFGNTALVRAALARPSTRQAFAAIQQRGTRANRAALMQRASAALTWEQIEARYPDVGQKVAEIKRWIAQGFRIGLSGGDVATRSGAQYLARFEALRKSGKSPSEARKLAIDDCPGCWGKAAAMAERNDPLVRGLDRRAIDEKGKRYYTSYFGQYGEDLVREIKRRVQADILERQAGRAAQAAPPAPAPAPAPDAAPAAVTSQAAPPPVAPPAEPTVASRQAQQAAGILEAHIRGVLAKEKKAGSYAVDPKDVKVAEVVECEGGGHIVRGTFRGRFESAARDKAVESVRKFEIHEVGGLAKGLRIE